MPVFLPIITTAPIFAVAIPCILRYKTPNKTKAFGSFGILEMARVSIRFPKNPCGIGIKMGEVIMSALLPFIPMGVAWKKVLGST